MSSRFCRISRYIEPKKLSGKDSWKISRLTITRSPTVMVPVTCSVHIPSQAEQSHQPLITPWAARNIAIVSALEKMTFWPEFRSDNDVVIFTDDFSYSARYLSYCATSNFSLLKCYWYRKSLWSYSEWVKILLYLDGFKIDKGIDGYGGGLIVSFVCISTELCPKNSVSNGKRPK